MASDETCHHHVALTCSEKIILIVISLFTLLLSSVILLHVSSSNFETINETLDPLITIKSILTETFFRFHDFVLDNTNFINFPFNFSIFTELRFENWKIHENSELNPFIIFPKELKYNYENVSRIAGQKGNGPKIRNGHHCPYLGFRKHSHYQLSQTILSTVCHQNIEYKQYCNVEVVKQDFNKRLSPQSLKGFNRDSRVRGHQFAQCCDNLDFQFNFKKRIDDGTKMEELERIIPKAVLKQLHSVLLMSDLVSFDDLARRVDWNALHIFDFFHDDRSKKRILRWIPEILYSESKFLAALKFGLWAHQFTKYGTCVTNQIYENYVDQAFNVDKFVDAMSEVIDRRIENEKVWRSDPELYFDLMYLLHRRFDYFRRDDKVFLKHFPPSLTKTYRVSDIKAKIYELFGDQVMLSCAISQNYTHPLVYQFHTCMKVEDVEPLAFYLMERKERYRNGDQSVKIQSLIKDTQMLSILDKVKSDGCLVNPLFNRTEFNQNYFNNYTDMINHFKYQDDPNIQNVNECSDEEFVLIPDTAELLKRFKEGEDGKIVEVDESELELAFDFGFLANEVENVNQEQEPNNSDTESNV
ncbi:predicted protein [Naegleria gruberi]|uniref:Predicted protein n=1 Tax=Naegleria gruberi TaxID=5762 RepID=D2V0V4_NAEGR|nr:uncharacterized protein NAEGRDRAFT_62428 [Naegleria gruberi]EFC49580.1 predicted protein [Naegleria gruberi]|eukprot:XP_002682324.1 predicted protein [Naegleria gruberi strain NEG-M]